MSTVSSTSSPAAPGTGPAVPEQRTTVVTVPSGDAGRDGNDLDPKPDLAGRYRPIGIAAVAAAASLKRRDGSRRARNS